MEQQIQLNDHNKQEYPPMHTAEHLLNATMVKTFGCPRSRNAHIRSEEHTSDSSHNNQSRMPSSA